MAELKTKVNDADVNDFLNKIDDEKKRADAFEILGIFKEVTGAEPKMWGGSIIGFGDYHYKYESGREGDWFEAGFSPRKQNFSIYILSGLTSRGEYLSKLGKYKTGKSCLYIKKLDDIDKNVLREIIENSVKSIRSGNQSGAC
ncbi:MAG: DUF1801 domain-containing protein [Bacteroidota bacterium]